MVATAASTWQRQQQQWRDTTMAAAAARQWQHRQQRYDSSGSGFSNAGNHSSLVLPHHQHPFHSHQLHRSFATSSSLPASKRTNGRVSDTRRPSNHAWSPCKNCKVSVTTTSAAHYRHHSSFPAHSPTTPCLPPTPPPTAPHASMHSLATLQTSKRSP